MINRIIKSNKFKVLISIKTEFVILIIMGMYNNKTVKKVERDTILEIK